MTEEENQEGTKLAAKKSQDVFQYTNHIALLTGIYFEVTFWDCLSCNSWVRKKCFKILVKV